MSIPAYLILGSPTCGRRGIACDVVEKALGDGEFCCVFVAAGERASDFDKRIAASPHAGIVKYADTHDAAEKIAALDPEKITSVIFVADASRNLADVIEEFKSIVDGGKIRLARIWSVIDCSTYVKYPDKYRPYGDALSHFGDCLLLSCRAHVSNQAVNDIRTRYEKMCRPHIIEYVDKKFEVAHPMELMIEEARRITMMFDEYDPVDELELDEENLPDEPFSLERKPDPYMERIQNGNRKNPIPDIEKYAREVRDNERKFDEKYNF